MSANKKRKKVKEHALDQETYSKIYWQDFEPQIQLLQEARHLFMCVLATSSDDHLLVIVEEYAKKLESGLGEDSPNLPLCKMWLTFIRAYHESTRRERSLEQRCREALVEILEHDLPLQFDQKCLFVDSVVREIDHDNEPF